MMHWLQHVLAGMGPWTYVVIGLAAGLECAALLGLIVPGETLVFVGGFFAARGTLALPLLLGTVAVAAVLGDTVGFELGRRLGRDWLIRAGRHVRLRPPDVERVERLFHRHGGRAVFIARFLTFARSIAPFVAGMSEMRYRQFLPYNAAGAVVWSVAAVFVGYGLAAAWDVAERWVTAVTLGIGAAVILGAVIWWRRRSRRGAQARTGAHRTRAHRTRRPAARQSAGGRH